MVLRITAVRWLFPSPPVLTLFVLLLMRLLSKPECELALLTPANVLPQLFPPADSGHCQASLSLQYFLSIVRDKLEHKSMNGPLSGEGPDPEGTCLAHKLGFQPTQSANHSQAFPVDVQLIRQLGLQAESHCTFV